MAWIFLLTAGIFEILWVLGIKHCQGFRITLPLIFVIFSMAGSVIFLWLAAKTIPMTIAYAIWTGIGIVGVFAYGVFFLKESFSMINIIFATLILVGVIGLKLSTK